MSEYVQDMRAEMKARLPMRPGLNGETGETLMNIHLQVIAKKRLELQESISPYRSRSSSDKLSVMECELIAYFDSSVAELGAQGEVTGGPLFDFIQDNIKSSEEFCTSLYKVKYEKMIELKLQNALSEQIPTSIDEKLQDLFKEYHEEALGPAKESVYERLRAESAKLESELLLIPGPVTYMRFVGISDDRVKIRWERPTVNPQAAELYKVRIKSKGKDWETLSIRKGLSALVTGLHTNTWYCLSVLACNQKYTGMKFCTLKFLSQYSKAMKIPILVAGGVAGGLLFVSYQLNNWAKKKGDITSDDTEVVDVHQGGATGGIDSKEHVELSSDFEPDFDSSLDTVEVDNTQLQDLVDSEEDEN